MKNYLTNQQQKFAIKGLNFSYKVAQSYKYVTSEYNGRKGPTTAKLDKFKIRCSCDEGSLILQDGAVCQKCGRFFGKKSDILVSKPLWDEWHNKVNDEDWRHKGESTKVTRDEFYYVEIHPEHNDGLLVHRVKPIATINQAGEDVVDFKVLYITEFVPGVGFKGYKNNKTELKEVDVLESLNITSRTGFGKIVLFDGCKDGLEFAEKNPEMGKHTGLLDFFYNVSASKFTGMIIYLALYAKYPVIELLLKMKCYNLVKKAFADVRWGCNVDEIRSKVERLSKLLNNETTKGSLSLKIPTYIANYLELRNADIETYLRFCDIYQLDKTLSKENFNKIRFSEEFGVAMEKLEGWHSVVDNIVDVMTYKYKLCEVLKYASKQAKDKYNVEEYETILLSLYDYNRMCDLMDVEAQKFPKDIQKVHDATSKAFKSLENEMNDKSIHQVSVDYRPIVNDLNGKTKTEYMIFMPESSLDLVEEGQQQHNCVGTYINSVANRRSIIFFIRKKEEPQSSFVTAELKNGYLNQIFYKNNVAVHDKEIIDLADSFVSKANKMQVKYAI